jgi:hypothetical protein
MSNAIQDARYISGRERNPVVRIASLLPLLIALLLVLLWIWLAR